MIIFRLFGILGLLLIARGVLVRRRKQQDLFYIFGGFCMMGYSLALGDAIFIILQIVFLAAAIVDYIDHLKSSRV